MNKQIRRACAEDAVAVSNIDHCVNPRPWTLSRIRSLCESGATATTQSELATHVHILVMDVAGEVSGYIVIACIPGEGEIQNLGVSPAKQGNGFGRDLVEAGVDLLRDRNASRCLLEVRQSNNRARSLYESFGFVIDGVRKNYYQSGQGREDAILMSLELQGELRERT